MREYVMGCIIELDGVRFDFTQNRFKQKLLLDILVLYMSFEMNELSKILDVPLQLLNKVHRGEQFLSYLAAQRLGKIFLLTFSNPGRCVN